jgi:putative transposase
MPRSPREEFPGAIHHVWARGNRKALIFLDDFDRLRYLVLLARVVERFGWRCLAYCLMGNHMHLVLETPEANLGDGMERLHGEYAISFNQRHALSGHVFQDRFSNKRPTSDPQMWQLMRYVALNPVVAGLCRFPEQWRWSSHAALAGLASFVPAWLDVERALFYFASAGGDPRTRYVEFVG